MMMKRLFPLLASLLLLAPPAGALKMSIWDREMQTPVGAGESNAGRFNVQLVKSYSGPVIVIFSQSDEEKRSAAYSGLQNRYDGVLKNGQLTLMPDSSEKQNDKTSSDKVLKDKKDARPVPASAVPASVPAPLPGGPSSTGLTLKNLLQQFKLTVTVQTTGQTNPSQDNGKQDRENVPPGAASTASGNNGNGNNGNGNGIGNGNGNFKSLDLKNK